MQSETLSLALMAGAQPRT